MRNRTILVSAMLAGAVIAAVASAAAQTAAPAAQPLVVSTGDMAGDVLMYATTAFGTVITGFVVNLLMKIAKKIGINVTDQLRERLSQIVLNGINLGAAEARKDLAGHGGVEIRSAAVAKAIEYTQAHGADTIKALGLDPNSGEAVEAIRARVETMIADPNVATPGVPGSANPPCA
jgi:hypothetical protein